MLRLQVHLYDPNASVQELSAGAGSFDGRGYTLAGIRFSGQRKNAALFYSRQAVIVGAMDIPYRLIRTKSHRHGAIMVCAKRHTLCQQVHLIHAAEAFLAKQKLPVLQREGTFPGKQAAGNIQR